MTAKDLLHKILDYNYLWAFPDVKNDKPATTRLAQIEVLLDAFGLTKKYANPLIEIKYQYDGLTFNRRQQLDRLTNLQYVLDGEFLRDREEGADKELSEKVLLKIEELYPGSKNNINNNLIHMKWLFGNLLSFRQNIHKIAFSKTGMSEGFSTGLYYSHYLQAQLKEIIKANLSEIDETLWEILDPLKRTVSKEEINYPDADLDKIDLEWRVENY